MHDYGTTGSLSICLCKCRELFFLRISLNVRYNTVNAFLSSCKVGQIRIKMKFSPKGIATYYKGKRRSFDSGK